MDSGTPVPQLIAGRYRLVEELGHGASALVFAADDLQEGRRVAVKLLRPDVSAILGRERFLREIRIVSILEHPNILPLLDSGADDIWVYLVAPLVSGGTLRARLERERQLPVTEVVRIGAEVAAALAAAHDAHVVHRDVKPENILLDDGRAVLADFGVAKAVFASGAADNLSTTGIVMGTPHYMSPEQSGGAGIVDGRSDLYSLGCVVYEMLTGEQPFTGSSAQVIAMRHAFDTVPSLRLMRPDAPGGLDPVLRRALAKVPGDRFQTAGEFREALLAAETRSESGAPLRDGRASVRRAVLRGTVGALAVAAAVHLVVSLPGEDSPGDAPPPPAEPQITEIGVRPFEDLSGDGSLRMMARGLTLDLISELATLSVVRVRSASAMEPLATASPDSIGRALRVGTLIEGSVRRLRDSLLVTVRLVNATTGTEFETYRTTMGVGRLFALDQTIRDDVVRFLRTRLGQEIQVTRQRSGTTNIEAWEHFQRASRLVDDAHELERSGFVPGALRVLASADSLFRAAEAADPRWQRPTLARGWTDLLRARVHDLQPTPDPALRLANSAVAVADRVIALSGPDVAEAHELKGTALLWLARNDPARAREDGRTLARAEAALRAGAVAGNPHEARAWSTLSTLLRIQGKFSDANVAARQAWETDAFMAEAGDVLVQLCSTAFDIDRPAEAADWCTEGRKRFPSAFEFPYHLLQMMQSPSGPAANADSAWALYREMERSTSAGGWPAIEGGARMMVAGVLGRAGLRDSARRVLATAQARGRAQADLDVYEATALLALGDTTGALERIARYVSGHPDMRSTVAGHPSFAGLRNHPRFEQLVGRSRQ